MNAILDVAYGAHTAVTACVAFEGWTDRLPQSVATWVLEGVADYVPGRFFERELPCLRDALERGDGRFDVLVIDGFVHLKPPRIKGLGCRLAESMGYPVAVIGIAKNPLKIADHFAPVLRGRSRKPLYVSSVGMRLHRAAGLVAGMHGDHRLPTLVKLADQAAREGLGARRNQA